MSLLNKDNRWSDLSFDARRVLRTDVSISDTELRDRLYGKVLPFLRGRNEEVVGVFGWRMGLGVDEKGGGKELHLHGSFTHGKAIALILLAVAAFMCFRYGGMSGVEITKSIYNLSDNEYQQHVTRILMYQGDEAMQSFFRRGITLRNWLGWIIPGILLAVAGILVGLLPWRAKRALDETLREL